MDLRRFAIPPLVLCAIGALLYGFAAFDPFVVDAASEAKRARAEQHVSVVSAARVASKLTSAALHEIQPVELPKATPAVPMVSQSTVQLATASPMAIQPDPLALNRPSPVSDSSLAEEDAEHLTEISSDAVGDGEQPLIQAPPSMATQATPLEMSDDGQSEAVAAENEG